MTDWKDVAMVAVIAAGIVALSFPVTRCSTDNARGFREHEAHMRQIEVNAIRGANGP